MRSHPYAHASRLPEGEDLAPSGLLDSPGERTELEVGPGRGSFLLERVQTEATLSMVGLEVRWKWAAIVDQRLRTMGLGERARVFAEDARVALPRFRTASLSAVFVHFPDPWWKRRHGKRRVITPALVREVQRLLVPGGEFFVQTDVEERAIEYEAAVRACSELEPWGDSARVAESPFIARSPRERRVELDGLPVVRLRYRRTTAPSSSSSLTPG
ncbi:tRNA (guanine(46)-N(7))-methyltransferase TrmB [Myxococcota bacterium]